MSVPKLPKLELSEEIVNELKQFKKEVERMDLMLILGRYKAKQETYVARRKQLREKPNFWFTVLTSNDDVGSCTEEEDLDALKYLEDIWISRNPVEPRAFSIELTFKENPYFEDKVLKKEFRFIESEEFKRQRPDAQGFRWAMLGFEWEKDVQPQPTHITWKVGKDLCQKYPPIRKDDSLEELGSFFNWLQLPGDAFSLGMIIVEDIFPDATTYYKIGAPEDVELESDEPPPDLEGGADNSGEGGNPPAADPGVPQSIVPFSLIVTVIILLVIRAMPTY